MSPAISSAIPDNLLRYSTVGTQLDAELIAESGRLTGILQHFEATCNEPGYAIRVAHLSDNLRDFAKRAEPFDRWVGFVGHQFLRADTGQRITTSDRLVSAGAPRRGSQVHQFFKSLPTLLELAGGMVLVKSLGARGRSLSLAWVKILKPSTVRTLLGIKARHIRFQNLLRHESAVIGKVALALDVALRWAEDVQQYQGSRRLSALTVDAALAVVALKIGTVAGTGLLLVTSPGVFTAIAAVGVVAVVSVATDWALEASGVRRSAIDALDVAFQWTQDLGRKAVDGGARTARALDEKIFRPIAKAISTKVDVVHEWVDLAARRLRQGLQYAK
ncbi:MAG: hypothetical protein QXS54_02420 [Candidatus Methanomethylicaceae archaeon]